MLDIKYIRDHAEEVATNCLNRGSKADIPRLLTLDKEKNELAAKIDEFRSVRNKIKGKPSAAEIAKLAKSKAEEEKLSDKLSDIEAEYRDIWFSVPNLTHPEVHVSQDEDDNPVLEAGRPTKFSFTPLDHLVLAEKHNLIDFDRATKVAGAKFYYLKNELALMELALASYAMEIAVKHGFTPFTTPDVAKREVLYGLGFNPRGDSTQVYNLEDTDLSLIGTAEITMGGYHMDEVLDAKSLPLKYVALSHCFRTEAGSYSKFSKGIFRVHQFTKVEMFQYVLPEKAESAHRELLEIEKEIFSGLQIPYRVIDHCTADLGAPAIQTFDLEAWMPGKPNKDGSLGDWAEVTSTSNCTDYQSRALSIKYKDGDKKDFVYMINGTAVATTRALIAIIENNQQADGSIKIPKVLQKWVGKDSIK